MRALVVAAVPCVPICSDQIKIVVSLAGLVSVLASEPPAWLELKPGQPSDCDPTVCVTVESQLRRAGLGKRLVIDGNQGVTRRTNPDPALIALLSKAHNFHSQLLQTRAANLKEVAETAGISASYLTRLVRLAYLAPDITRAILEGSQPPTLTASALIKASRLPLDWGDQRRLLGFV